MLGDQSRVAGICHSEFEGIWKCEQRQVSAPHGAYSNGKTQVFSGNGAMKKNSTNGINLLSTMDKKASGVKIYKPGDIRGQVRKSHGPYRPGQGVCSAF